MASMNIVGRGVPRAPQAAAAGMSRWPAPIPAPMRASGAPLGGLSKTIAQAKAFRLNQQKAKTGRMAKVTSQPQWAAPSRGLKVIEDDPRWNPATMGNRKGY